MIVIDFLKDAGISIPYEIYILTRKNLSLDLSGVVSALIIRSNFKKSIANVNRVVSHVLGYI